MLVQGQFSSGADYPSYKSYPSAALPYIWTQYIKHGKINEQYKFRRVLRLKNIRVLSIIPNPLSILFLIFPKEFFMFPCK